MSKSITVYGVIMSNSKLLATRKYLKNGIFKKKRSRELWHIGKLVKERVNRKYPELYPKKIEESQRLAIYNPDKTFDISQSTCQVFAYPEEARALIIKCIELHEYRQQLHLGRKKNKGKRQRMKKNKIT